jgi:PEGA domain
MLRPSLMRLSPSLAVVIASCLAVLPARADSPAGPVTPTPPAPASKPAGAADAPPPDPVKVAADKQAALIKKGSELCAAGEVAEGLTSLRAAWAHNEDAELAATIAACEVKASDWPSAATYFAYALRTVSDPEQRKPLEAAFTDARARVGAVKVTVSIDGADVFVGDDFAGQSPLPGEVYVAPGTTRITAKRTGYGEVDGTVSVQARGTTTLKLDLAAGSTGGSTHHFAERRSVTPAYVLGAVGLIAAGAGAALYAVGATKGAAADALLAELQTANTSKTPCATYIGGCNTLASLRSGHDTFTDVGAGVLIGGGALLAVGLIYGVRASAAPATDRAGLTLVPVASPSGGGVLAHGTF